MGLGGLSNSVHDDGAVVVADDVLKPPNPNPYKFVIQKTETIGNFCVVDVRYHGCTNYEGRKILLFDKKQFNKAQGMKCLDPHFSENGPSPIARFEPTQRGWDLALSMAAVMQLNE